MKVVVCGSVNFPEKMKEVEAGLKKRGHDVVLPYSITRYNLHTCEDAQRLKQSPEYLESTKGELTIRHFDEIKNCDAILVVNVEKMLPLPQDNQDGNRHLHTIQREMQKGIPNYIGGATFAEMMFAFYMRKRIFLLNPIPDHEKLEFFRDEIEGIHPVVINGNLDLIK